MHARKRSKHVGCCVCSAELAPEEQTSLDTLKSLGAHVRLTNPTSNTVCDLCVQKHKQR